MRQFSPWGFLLFTLWGVSLALVLGGWRLAALAALELAFGFAWNREGLRPLSRRRFWAFVLTAVALGSLLGGEPDLALGPVRLSRAGVAMGMEMAARAFAITLAFSLGTSALSLSDLIAIFDRLHLRGLGFAVGLAVNLLGSLREMATVTLQTLRLRGGMRRPFLALRLFLITLVSNTLRLGDQVVNAAAVRAFDPNEGRTLPLPAVQADLCLLVGLAACGVALLAVSS